MNFNFDRWVHTPKQKIGDRLGLVWPDTKQNTEGKK